MEENVDNKVTKHYLAVGPMKYFRGNAHRVELGTYGKKHDPIGAHAYLEPEARVKTEHLAARPIKFVGRVKIAWNEVSSADLDVGADLKLFGLGKKVAVGFDLKDAREGKLELVSLAINPGPLRTMLNKDADGARKFLAEEGNDARIVSEVKLVVDAELGEHFAANGEAGLSVEAFGSTLNVNVSGGTKGTQTISYSPGTTFAYMLHKVRKWNKDKSWIEELEDDYKGLG